MASRKQISLRMTPAAADETMLTGSGLGARGLAGRISARAAANGRSSDSLAAQALPRLCPVLLLGEPPIFLAGLRALLSHDASLRVVVEENGGASGLQAVAVAYGIVVFAAAVWTDSCAEALAVLRASHPRVRVVLLVADADPARMRQFLAGGGYAAMPMAAEVAAVLATIRGAYSAVTPAAGVDAPKPEQRSALSAREWLVLRCKVNGHTNKAIAAELDISVKTVETYYTRGMEKLGLHSRAEILQYAVIQGWLTGT